MKAINFKFDERKAAQVAGRLISQGGGEMNYMALLKLLYLIDREALLRWGKTVTGDKIVAMKHGPVLSRIFDLISQKKQGLPKISSRRRSCCSPRVWMPRLAWPGQRLRRVDSRTP